MGILTPKTDQQLSGIGKNFDIKKVYKENKSFFNAAGWSILLIGTLRASTIYLNKSK